MSNYTKTTNFAAKDSLPSGNAAKIVKGAEIDTEFNNIATASATKANANNAALTGTTVFATLSDGTIAITGWVDEDNMASNSAVLIPTQQSVKAYVDSNVTAQDLDVTDGTTSIDIDLDSESLGILGGTGLTSTASGTGVTLAIDSTVTTLTGTQTLSNKTLTTPVISGALTTNSTIDGRDVAVDGTKLDGIEASADVTDTTNVTAAGALMDSEVTNLNQVKAFDSSDYATAAQGTTADAALPKAGGAMTGAITTNSTFDGRDVATDGTKLDGIEASADVTDTANVTAAGALMDSELTNITAVKALNQGVATGDSPTFVRVTSPLFISDDIDFANSPTSQIAVQIDTITSRLGIKSGSPDVTLDMQGAVDSIALPVGTTAQRPTGAAGMFRYNSSLDQFEGYTTEWGSIGGGGGTNTFTTDSFTGDGSTTAYALSQVTSSEDNLLVFIEGVFQQQDAYSIATPGGTTTLTFSAAPANGNAILIYSVAAAVSGSNLNIDSMTGDGSDTTLTLSIAPVNENNTQVFIDGVYQSKANYSISGTTLTFSTAPPTGTAVEVMTFTQTDINVPVDGTITPAKIASGDFYFDTNTLYVDATNNRVGISTSSPSSQLEIDESGSGDATIKVGNAQNVQTTNVGKQGATAYGATAAGAAFLYTYDNDISIMSDGGTGSIKFTTGGNTQKMELDASGNVQLGTGTPAYLVGTSDIAQLSVNRVGTSGAITNASRSAAYINLNGADGGSSIEFSTASANNTQPTEAMRIDSSGNLLVGPTVKESQGVTIYGNGANGIYSATTGTSAYWLTNYGLTSATGNYFTFYNNTTPTGNITITSTNVTNYTSVSDRRLKENIADADDAGSNIDAIQVRKFDWKFGGEHQDYGFIAQELLEIVPVAVSVPEDSEEMMSVDPAKLVPMMLKEIQSLRTRVQELENN